MQPKNKFYMAFCVAITCTMILSACSLNNSWIDYARLKIKTKDNDRISYTFSGFDDYQNEVVQAGKSQAISFEYNVELDSSSLIIERREPNGDIVWRRRLVGLENSRDEIANWITGEYRFAILGKEVAGSFSVPRQVK
jgi:hypothetical protein